MAIGAHWRAALGVVAIVIVALGAGWVVRDVVEAAHGDVIRAIRDVGAWGGDAAKVVAGAIVGALGAWVVARSNREAERRRGRQERTLRVAADLLAATENHIAELRRQLDWREEQPHAGWPFSDCPTVGPIDAMVVGVNQLYLVATQDAADAAGGMLNIIRAIDGLTIPRDALKRGAVGTWDRAYRDGFDRLEAAYVATKTAFMNDLRPEFDRAPLVPATPRVSTGADHD
ncbi:MAG TPA: hypothetical protein VIK13_00925 [Candidatus Limnocylindrales bacterium]